MPPEMTGRCGDYFAGVPDPGPRYRGGLLVTRSGLGYNCRDLGPHRPNRGFLFKGGEA